MLGILPDRSGGVYAWWKEGTNLRANHLDPNGQLVSGWSGCGVLLGQAYTNSPTPSVIEDGAHGLYVAWSKASVLRPWLVRIAPDGTVPVSMDVSPISFASWYPQVALAPDGGVFVAWGVSSADTAVSKWRLRRLDASGANAPGWPSDGLVLGGFNNGCSTQKTSTLSLAADGRGGVFAMFTAPYSYGPWLMRLTGEGLAAPDWPAAGVQPISWNSSYVCGPFAVLPDGQDGAFAEYTDLPYTDSPPYVELDRFLADGSFTSVGSTAGQLVGQPEVAMKGDGGLFLATFSPNGPYSQWGPSAFIDVQQSKAPSGWSDFSEYHFEPVVHWYGDIGLAPAPDSGCVFFWSQQRERFGLFAKRFSPGGELVAAVDPGPRATLALGALRFVAGRGVLAKVELPGNSPARLALHDVAGRVVAEMDLAGSRGISEVTLPGSAWLPSGIYFARLAAGGAVLSGRTLVLR